jgi:hypothetical protein
MHARIHRTLLPLVLVIIGVVLLFGVTHYSTVKSADSHTAHTTVAAPRDTWYREMPATSVPPRDTWYRETQPAGVAGSSTRAHVIDDWWNDPQSNSAGK